MPGCSREEAAQRGALIDVHHYDVHLDFVTDPSRVLSRTVIRFACSTPGAETFAQLTADEVRSIALNGRELDPGAVVVRDRVMLADLDSANELAVEAAHSYGDDGRGYSRHSGPDGSTFALAYAYPTSASSVFCCFDQPDLASPMHLSIDAPPASECITHATPISRPATGGMGTWTFEIPTIKPQELLVALGPYRTVTERDESGIGLPRVLCRPAIAEDLDTTRLVGLVRAAIDFYSELFGVPCPYGWLDVAFVPELPPLAVCVPGFVGLHEDLARRIADRDDDFATMVVGHELAHLWFGCIVDCRWWDDLWLAEALATWASFVAGERRLGMHAAWAEFALAEKARAYEADQLPTTEPVASPVETAASATSRPSELTYCKGAAVVRQLEALIGERAVREGLQRYFERFAGGTATLQDMVRCWSDASGDDLSAWSAEWLEAAGVNLLRPEVGIAPDGTIKSFAVVQEPPDEPRPSPVLRRHSVRVGLYDDVGEQLRLRQAVDVVIEGERTEVAHLVGVRAPHVVLLNEGDLAYARVRLDSSSLSCLTAHSFELPDPVSESVCWNLLWDMTVSAELSPRQFVDAVASRIHRSGQPPAVDELGARAVRAADYYAVPASRDELRTRLAHAYGERLEVERVRSSAWRKVAVVLAKSAGSPQLDTLHAWLEGDLLREPWSRDIARAALETLAAAGRLADVLLQEVTELDHASGAETRARCRARRPDPAGKEDAWHSALLPETPPRTARAAAEGFWTPGQEAMLTAWRSRYFDEALPALAEVGDLRARRVGAALYPLTLADDDTLSATGEALRSKELTPPLRGVLEEKMATVSRVIRARSL